MRTGFWPIFLLLVACASTQEPAPARNAGSPADAPAGPGPTVQPASTTRAAAAPVYPWTIERPGGTVVVHMPQVESWERFERLTARVALEVLPTGAAEDARWFGTLELAGETDIDFEERLVIIHDLEVIDFAVVGDREVPESLKDLVREALPLEGRTVPLATVLRALPPDFAVDSQRPGPRTEIRNEPPKIFVTTEPADLLLIDGEPVKAPLDTLPLEFVINTNWDLFWDPEGERWYLRQGDAWRTARSLDGGSWQTTRRLPEAFAELPDDANWEAVRAAVPAPAAPTPPRLFVSFEPAELIVLDGEPVFEPIEAGLALVSNTDADLFAYEGAFYYLVSGRWFRAAALDGPWSPVTALPEAFRAIPADHPKAHVLAAVPGTPDARAAVIEAQIPRTATVQVDAVPEIEVAYAGLPRFEPIEGTSLRRAVNTSYQVIEASDRYYLCHNAIWFVADEATGPWTVATEVPSEIYTIPASDPAHNVTYVYREPESSTVTTTYVTYAYLPGYYGVYYMTGAVVYGTGYYYAPYYAYYPWGYPGYWYYPRSYGYGSWYNPATGTYGRGAVAYGPYGGARAATSYNPTTGTYARGWSVWDSDELYRQGGAYNHRTGTFGGGNLYYDAGANEGWSQRLIQRGDRWVYGESEFGGGAARSEFETASGITGTSERTRSGQAIEGSGTITGPERSATTASAIDSEGYARQIESDQGMSAEVSKAWGERGRDVAVTDGDGGSTSGTAYATRQGQLYASDSGDLYASRDGNVYRRSEDGWSRYDSGGWNEVDPTAQTDFQTLDRHHEARTNGARQHGAYQSKRSFDRSRAGGGTIRGRRR